MVHSTSRLTSFSSSEPVNKILLFLLSTCFSSLLTQGLLLGNIVMVLTGILLSTQKEMYDVTVSTCSSMLLEDSKQAGKW